MIAKLISEIIGNKSILVKEYRIHPDDWHEIEKEIYSYSSGSMLYNNNKFMGIKIILDKNAKRL